MVEWRALESNPETINPFLEKIGITGLECVDVFSFEDEFLPFIPTPQHALILCFRDNDDAAYMNGLHDEMRAKGRDVSPNVFFMKQKIKNACGTFSLFHSLANLENAIDLGNGSFRKFLDAAKLVGEEDRSDVLANNGELASAHAETAASGDTDQPENVECHFMCYVNRDGILYEIDSVAPFPRSLGETSTETLVRDAGKAITELMKHVSNPSFSAMALVGRQ